jgi:hypothetical protein
MGSCRCVAISGAWVPVCPWVACAPCPEWLPHADLSTWSATVACTTTRPCHALPCHSQSELLKDLGESDEAVVRGEKIKESSSRQAKRIGWVPSVISSLQGLRYKGAITSGPHGLARHPVHKPARRGAAVAGPHTCPRKAILVHTKRHA